MLTTCFPFITDWNFGRCRVPRWNCLRAPFPGKMLMDRSWAACGYLWLSVAICGWDGNDHPHSARYLEYPRLKDARIYFVELDARILQVPGFLDSGWKCMGYTASVLRKKAFLLGHVQDDLPAIKRGGPTFMTYFITCHPKPKMLLMLPQVFFSQGIRFLAISSNAGFKAALSPRMPFCVPRARWKMGSWGADGKVFAVPQKTPKTGFGFLSCFRFLLLLYLSICRLMYHYWLISPMIFHTVFPYRTPEEDSQGGFYHDF